MFILMVPSSGLIKLSVLYLYRRTFVKGVFGHFDLITKPAIGIIVLWTLICFFLQTFICGKDVGAYWGEGLSGEGRCLSALKVNLGIYATDTITDVLVFILPIPIVSSKRSFSDT